MKQMIRDKIGSGISEVITPQEIFDAVGSHEIGFYFNESAEKWIKGSGIPAASKNTIAYPDVVIDLEHDTDLSAESDAFGEDWTVSDYIQEELNRYEREVRERHRDD